MKNVILLFLLGFLIVGGFMVIGRQEVLAQSQSAANSGQQQGCTGDNGNNPCLPNPLSENGGPLQSPEILYGRIIKAFLAFVGIGSLVAFVFAGGLFVFSGGNPERVKKARDSMVYAVIGIAVSLGSYVILSFVIEALKGTLVN